MLSRDLLELLNHVRILDRGGSRHPRRTRRRHWWSIAEEAGQGSFASGEGARRLPEQIPHKRAVELILRGNPLSAEKAYALSLVNSVVLPDRVLDEALVLTNRITVKAPLSVSVSKCIARGVVGGEVARERE